MKKTMGIVGFGRFGRLVATHLKDSFGLIVYDRNDCREAASQVGVKTGPLEEVANSSIVVLCVPISQMEPVLREISPLVARECLVVDTCSVKEYPVSLMTSILPKTVEILGTHPLFGPDSAADGLYGKKIVLCPVRIENLKRTVVFLRGLRLHVMICSPREHDQTMASTQTIVQFLGRAFLEMGLTHEIMATPGYDRLIRILEVVQHDTWELFRDLQTLNPHAKKVRQRLIESLTNIDRGIGEIFPLASEHKEEEEEAYEGRVSGRTRRIQ
jgi:prephenate dehydrogenase